MARPVPSKVEGMAMIQTMWHGLAARENTAKMAVPQTIKLTEYTHWDRTQQAYKG